MSGFVSLLGAGPGHEDLITVKGLNRIKEADVIVYDRLVNKALLRFAKPTVELIYVGKIPGQKCISQSEIEEVLVTKAKENKKVVRLKSGDPYIFGRGGEEAIELKKHHIGFEIVPGVTSAIAGLTYAGIPATYRDIATSFHVITGHLQDETEQLNWSAISQLKGTLIFLMGMKNLPIIAEKLMEHGYRADMPVAIVQWGTHGQQRSIQGQLDNIVALVEEHGFGAPSIIVVGEVVAFKEELNFFENLPLFGKRVLVQDSQTGKLPRLLKDYGATLVTFPSRDKVVTLDFKLPELNQLKGIVVSDSHGWQLFMKKLVDMGKDIRQLAHLDIIAIGHHTTKLLKESGIQPVVTFEQWDKDALLSKLETPEKWVVLTDESRVSRFSQGVNAIFVATHQLIATKSVNVEDLNHIDAICLPNSLAAETLVSLVNTEQLQTLKDVPVVLMGNTTKSTLEASDFNHFVQTKEATILSMIEATIETVSK